MSDVVGGPGEASAGGGSERSRRWGQEPDGQRSAVHHRLGETQSDDSHRLIPTLSVKVTAGSTWFNVFYSITCEKTHGAARLLRLFSPKQTLSSTVPTWTTAACIFLVMVFLDYRQIFFLKQIRNYQNDLHTDWNRNTPENKINTTVWFRHLREELCICIFTSFSFTAIRSPKKDCQTVTEHCECCRYRRLFEYFASRALNCKQRGSHWNSHFKEGDQTLRTDWAFHRKSDI